MNITDLIGALPGALNQGLVWGVMAIGVYITYRIMDIADLTVDGSICTGAAVCTVMIVGGVNPWIAMLCAFFSGVLAGLLTGAFHVFFGIPAILSGILTQMILWSANLKIMGKANISISARDFPVIITQMQTYKTIGILIACTVVLIVILYWFFGTELGSAIRSTGNNEAMSRAQGINTDMIKLLGLALSNGIVALSGALLCQYQGFSDINMGRGAVVIGLAAVVIGKALIKHLPKNFALRLASVSVGAIVYYLVYQTVIFLGVDSDLLKMLSAVVVAAFLGFPYVMKKINFKKGKESGKNA